MTEFIQISEERFGRPHLAHRNANGDGRVTRGDLEREEEGVTALLSTLLATCERILTRVDELPTRDAHLKEPVDQAPLAPSTQSLCPKTISAGLKQMLKLRSRRRRNHANQIFDWPAWDMLLDLASVKAEGGHVSVSAVCISSGAPQSTALRKLAALERARLVRRYVQGPDRRRVCLTLTEEASVLVVSVLQEELAFYRAISGGP